MKPFAVQFCPRVPVDFLAQKQELIIRQGIIHDIDLVRSFLNLLVWTTLVTPMDGWRVPIVFIVKIINGYLLSQFVLMVRMQLFYCIIL